MNFFPFFFIFLFTNVSYLSAQNTIIEYNIKLNPINDYLGREFLIYNKTEAFYFDYVDGADTKIYDIIKNYNIRRGGEKSYRKLDNLNQIIRIKSYPNSGQVHYLIEDNKPNIEWKIENESKEILGFKCKKAVGKFRGRNYIAWFTSELPVSLGPWKIDGLPGLILKAEDKDNVFSYEAVQVICNSDYNIPSSIYEFLEKYDKSKIKTYKDYIEQENAYFREIQIKSRANLPKETIISEIPPIRQFSRETEFEWEAAKKP